MRVFFYRRKMIRKSVLACLLSVSCLVGMTANGEPRAAQAAYAHTQKDDFKSSLADSIGILMNRQIIAALSGSDGTRAKIKKETKEGYKSAVTFTFPAEKLGGMGAQRLLPYVMEAIAQYPNLCTLSSDISCRWGAKEVQMTVYSVVAKKSHATAIRKYKAFLADIEQVPLSSGTMTDTEILLYLHDRVVQQASYTATPSDNRIYVPYTMSSSGKVVCQPYASVMNHLMRDLGFVSHVINSETHSWNIVKLNGKWTCIDATWDDPTGQRRDYVMHKYLLVPLSTFASGHVPDSSMLTRYSGITSKVTGETSILPKSTKLTLPACYAGSIWFYIQDGTLYRWDGTSSSGKEETAVSKDAHRCVNVINDKVYIGGTDGLRTYDPATGAMKVLDNQIDVNGLFYYNKKLYYRNGSKWYAFVQRSASSPSYESLNGSAEYEKVSLVKPGKPVISIMKNSAKSLRVTVTGRAGNANAGYQVQVSKTRSFSKKKTVTFSGLSGSVTGLASGVRYYVRVRGIWKNGFLMKYGEWSGVAG